MSAYLTTILILVCEAALVGLALNLQWGLAGLVNFAIVGFVAIGAYSTALLSPAIGWLPAMLIAAAIAALLSGALALLSIRLEENYLAIVTLGFGEVVRLVILNEDWLTKGALGIADIPRPFVSETPAKIGIAPTLGEHNDEVLQSIGYGTADIARLREQNII